MKIRIDKYFLDEICPFSKKARIKWKAIKVFGATFGVLSLLFLLLLTPDAPENKHDARTHSENAPLSNSTPFYETGSKPHTDPFIASYEKGSRASRQYGASQLVKRSDSGNGGDKLPLGSTLAAKLVNSIISTDSNSPVIAEIVEDIIWKNSVIIPAQTRAIGQGTLDSATERLQARFTTLVYPEGDQHPISALALLTDGSSGIAGDFHSRTFSKHASRFSGNFIGGLAQGLKEKAPSGQFGSVFEPGSLKNGVLNGIANSATDLAGSLAQDTQKQAPYLEVPIGTSFVIYLEREYSP